MYSCRPQVLSNRVSKGGSVALRPSPFLCFRKKGALIHRKELATQKKRVEYWRKAGDRGIVEGVGERGTS